MMMRARLAIALSLLLLAIGVVAASSALTPKNPGPGSPPGSGGSSDDWLQWGGPSRDFKSDATGLADSWPPGGPPRLWSRELGEGYSAIVLDGETLFTLYRDGEAEAVIALDADTGNTLWEYRYAAPTAGYNFRQGTGPHASPLVVADRVFTVGATGKLHALSKADGSPIWTHDLREEFGATFRNRGYSSSPIAYGDTVIALVGGQGKAAMAFHMRDGAVAWSGGDFENGYSSPILIDLEGQNQLVALMAAEIAGFDPTSGEVLWSHPHPTRGAFNISTPVWGDGNILFTSSAYDGGSRAVRLTRQGEETTAEELWFSNRMRVHIGTVIRVDDTVYGSSGDFGPAFLIAADVLTGEEHWRDRSFAKASFIYADEKLILLDEDGALALATVSPDGLRVHSRFSVFDSLSWTVPTLVGTKLYLRNRHSIIAMELGS